MRFVAVADPGSEKGGGEAILVQIRGLFKELGQKRWAPLLLYIVAPELNGPICHY